MIERSKTNVNILPFFFSLIFTVFLFSLFSNSFHPSSYSVHVFPLSPFPAFSLQSLDEDCTLEEEDEGLIEEEDEIDQFNDDTFGAGAVGM